MFIKNKNLNFRHIRRMNFLPASVILVGSIVVLSFIWHWFTNDNSNPSLGTSNTTPKATSIDKAIKKPAGTTTESSGPKNPTASGTSSSSPSGTLVAPYRVTYASNHTPTSAGDTELSSFTTTPGASCRIEFTKEGVIRSLQTKPADSNGTVVWYWKPSQVGLTAGSWKITAVATLNGQTKSSSDLILLQVP